VSTASERGSIRGLGLTGFQVVQEDGVTGGARSPPHRRQDPESGSRWRAGRLGRGCERV